MRRKFSLIMLCAVLLASCQVDDEMYTVYDVYYQLAFATDSTNAVIGSAAKKDSLDKRDAEWLKVKGGFEYVGSNIVRYGHVWAKGKDAPVINAEETNCKYFEGKPDSKEPFYTTIPNLECETEYSIRSFVVTADGKIGYNPETLVAVTDHPHDMWYISDGFSKNTINAGRADAVSVMLIEKTGDNVDTLTFFGMGRAGDVCYADMWCYSSHNKTFEQIPEIKSNTGEIMRLWGATGFGINYSEQGKQHHLVYVGCGCSRANEYQRDDYNQKFFVYDIDQRKWKEITYYDGKNVELTKRPFQGEIRTGAVGFSVREWGFVGLGDFQNKPGAGLHYHTDFYLFVMEKDPLTGVYTPEKGFFNQMTEDFGFGGRTGSSAVVVDDVAYIIGGKGAKGYYDQFISCQFAMPINSRPDSYTFSWPKGNNIVHFNDHLGDYNFKARAFGSAFSVDGVIYYGMGEGEGTDGKKEYYSNMLKFDRNRSFLPEVCSPYMNEDMGDSRVSRALVVNGGDRAFVVGGEKQGTGDYTVFSNSEWVYRP